MITELITKEKLLPQIQSQSFIQHVFTFWSIGSTNEFARKLALQNQPEGTLVIAEEQSRGRGRMHRKWESQFGKGLWFSIILRPSAPTSEIGLYPFLAGVSVAEAIENKFHITPNMKWPNDLMFNERKFCGILSEVEFVNNHLDFIILGIGINVNHKLYDFSEELRDRVTSLSIARHHKVDRIKFLVEIINRVGQNYRDTERDGFAKIIAAWKKRCSLIKKKISIEQDDQVISGVFEDLAHDGGMLLRTEGGTLTKIIVGDVI
jgi:BirA family transcriptional regulator, biotin operon repressor / biotin---[acetyl-CoA-carboxylase] ligase